MSTINFMLSWFKLYFTCIIYDKYTKQHRLWLLYKFNHYTNGIQKKVKWLIQNCIPKFRAQLSWAWWKFYNLRAMLICFGWEIMGNKRNFNYMYMYTLLAEGLLSYIFILASYDSTGSIPTTDISIETHSSHVTQESTYPKRNQPVPHSQQPRKPVEDPFISPASHQVCCRSYMSKHMQYWIKAWFLLRPWDPGNQQKLSPM